MIELTEQQQHALDASPAPRLVDPRTKKTYVLISADLFERMRSLMCDDGGLEMRQVADLVETAMREDDAADSTLAYYQEKYGRNP